MIHHFAGARHLVGNTYNSKTKTTGILAGELLMKFMNRPTCMPHRCLQRPEIQLVRLADIQSIKNCVADMHVDQIRFQV